MTIEGLRSRVQAAPGDFEARLRLGRALVAEGRTREAEEHLRAAVRLFPEYPEKDSPYEALARVHLAEGDTGAAAGALRAAGRLNESAWEFAVREAELRRELGDLEGEQRALERAVEIFPFALDEQTRLGEVAMETGDFDRAVAARRAVVGLGPVDVAEAQYGLARAAWAAGNAATARSAVLRALEIAPSFDEALDLLLEIRGGGE